MLIVGSFHLSEIRAGPPCQIHGTEAKDCLLSRKLGHWAPQLWHTTQRHNSMTSVRVRYTRQDERSLQAEPSAVVPGCYLLSINIHGNMSSRLLQTMSTVAKGRTCFLIMQVLHGMQDYAMDQCMCVLDRL